MRDQPRQVLCGLIARYGHALADDRDRCSGLLRDLCPADKPEIKVLLTAQEEGIAAALAGVSQASVPDALVARLTKRLRDDCHMTDEAARWAVESWALALGVIAAPVAPMPTPVPTPPAPTPTPTPAPTPIPTPAPGSGGVRVGAGAMALLVVLAAGSIAIKNNLDKAEQERQQAERQAEQARQERDAARFSEAQAQQAKSQAEARAELAERVRKDTVQTLVLPAPSAVPAQPVDPDSTGAGTYIRKMIDAAVMDDQAAVMAYHDSMVLIAQRAHKPKTAARRLNSEGLEYLKLGQVAASVAKFRQAYHVDSADVEIVNNLGYGLYMEGNYAEAREILTRALIMNPGRATAWGNLAQTYAELGDTRSSIGCIQNSYRFSKNPENTRIFFLDQLALTSNPNYRTAIEVAMKQVESKRMLRQ